PATAGWNTLDVTAQDGLWWHIESTSLNAGHATDISGATPFGGGDNMYSLWCGRANVCGWTTGSGYGDNWDQYVVLDCGAWTETAQVEFVFTSDYEGDDFDYMQVSVYIDGELVVLQSWMDAGPQPLRAIDISALASAYPGQELGDLVLHFHADGNLSSQTSGPYDMGPVWVDNIILTVDAVEVGRTDFEDQIQPDWMAFAAPDGAGIFGMLYSNLFSEDICTINNTFAWAFYDPESFDPLYPIPVVIYGPPYVNNGIQSPVLELAHPAGDPTGTPVSLGANSSVELDFWSYYDLPLNALVFTKWYVAAQTEEIPCLGAFASDIYVTYGADKVWSPGTEPVTQYVAESADGGTVTGIGIRLMVSDECETWCDEYGDGTGHTPAPYYDNVVLKILDASAIAWNIEQLYRFQDNFPEAGTGLVRLDIADNIAPIDSPTVVIGDSTLVELNMDLVGGMQSHYDDDAGEIRPDLYMYFRVTAGPHQGMTDAAMGDPDDSDGIYSPYIGTADFFGETWNCVLADSATKDGIVTDGTFAFDFNDEYFLPGD
ncbi:MAG: hypothetical protein GY835_23645, partial [bacterium]|nr:hypothetical protein [bacterium]